MKSFFYRLIHNNEPKPYAPQVVQFRELQQEVVFTFTNQQLVIGML